MLMVLKVSGHLYRFPDKINELARILTALIDSNVGVVVVPGGSVFADAVRNLQLSIGVDDEVAHWMAVKAMEVYGVFLKEFSPRAIEVYSIDDVHKALKDKLIPVVMPYRILREHDVLPHSWTVTSDSIAIYIAYLLKADIVALGKMVNGIMSRSGDIEKTIDIGSIPFHAKSIFDEYTPILIKKYGIPVAIFNITKPWILHKIAKTELDSYTLILP